MSQVLIKCANVFYRSRPNQQVKRSVSFFRRENVPIGALIVGLSAFCFQVFVLFPWHYELSEQIDALEVQTKAIDKLTENLDKKLVRIFIQFIC